MKSIDRNRLRTNRLTRAFTLVEMLLVLTILALLAGLVLPKIVGQGEKAKIKTAIAQIAGFKSALEMFEVDNQHFPKGRSGLNDLVVKPRDGTADWHQYLDKIPMDPWGNPYIYEYPGRHNPNTFDISSAGPDGQPGNDDDITNWDRR